MKDGQTLDDLQTELRKVEVRDMANKTVFQALERFAQRVAETDDPRQHQAAGRELQSALRRLASRRQQTATDASENKRAP